MRVKFHPVASAGAEILNALTELSVRKKRKCDLVVGVDPAGRGVCFRKFIERSGAGGIGAMNTKSAHYAFQPPQTMMPIPTTATAAPVTSHTVTGTRSTFQSQAIATAT
jgi:hypothetical protein